MTRKKVLFIFIILIILLIVVTISKLHFDNLSWANNSSMYQQLIVMALMFFYVIANYKKLK